MPKHVYWFCFFCFCGALCAAPSGTSPGIPPVEKSQKIVISTLPDPLKLILGHAKDQYYVPRVRAIHALPNNLPPDQIAACYEFLFKKMDSQQLPDLEFNGLKNELTFVLMRQQRKPAELAGNLVKMYQDKSYDETWRDYCVQFFGKWYPEAPENDGRRAMVAGLWDALQNERTTRLSGDASSQLAFLARRRPEFDRKKVAAASFEALNDPRCCNESKVALLQTCAVLGHDPVLPVARNLAATTRDPLLRASAIATIGMLGNTSDLKMLRAWERASDIRLQRPAKGAIANILQRTQPKVVAP